MDDDNGGDQRRPAAASTVVAIRPRFVLEVLGWVLLALVTLIVIRRSRHVLELVLLAIVIAVLLRGPINALDRRVARWAAITIVVITSIASVVGLLALGSVQLSQEIDVVGDAVTERIEQVDPESSLGRFLVDGRVAERIEERLDELPSQVILGSPDPADGARLGLEGLLVLVLVLYALLNGPKLARVALGGDHPRWWAKYVRDGVRSGASQVRRLLAVATISGFVGLAVGVGVRPPGHVGPRHLGRVVGGRTDLRAGRRLRADGRARIARRLAEGDRGRRARRPHRRRQLVRRPPRLLLGHPIHRPAHRPVRTHRRARRRTAVRLDGRPARDDLPDGRRGVDVRCARCPSSPGRDGVGDRCRTAQLRPASPAVSRWRHLDVRSAAMATSIVVIVVVAIALVIDLAPVPAWIIIGIVLAMALDPLVGWLIDHTPLGRGAAVGAVVVGLLAIVVAMLVFAVPSIVDSVRDLDDQLPRIAADLEQLPLIGDELAERGVADRLQTTLEEFPDRLASDTGLDRAHVALGR